MHMNTVMMLRRNRKPAAPMRNRMALRMRYQDTGTSVRDRRHLSQISFFARTTAPTMAIRISTDVTSNGSR